MLTMQLSFEGRSISIPFSSIPLAPRSPLFPYTTLFRSPGIAPGRIAGVASGVDFMPTLLDAVHLPRSEHTSELQSRFELVCRLLLEKKNPPPCNRRLQRHPTLGNPDHPSPARMQTDHNS